MKYKWPKADNQQLKQQLKQQILNKKTEEDVDVKVESLGTGIASVIMYFCSIFFIYISAIKNDSWKFKLNTLSYSLEKSNKSIVILLLMIFLALLQIFFSFQNIDVKNPKRAPVVAFNFVIITCILLLTVIFSNEKKKVVISHFMIAFCTIIALIINCFLISLTYEDYFFKKDIEPLNIISYIIFGVASIAGLLMLWGIKNGGFTIFLSKGIAFFELVCLILFGIFIILLVQYPPLPNDELSCVLK
jgi:hypothetical protein